MTDTVSKTTVEVNSPIIEARETDTGITETGKTENAKTETAKTETGKTETEKTETGKTETEKTEARKSAPANTEQPRSLTLTERFARCLIKQMVFLPWIQYPPIPRIPDLSDPSRFRWSLPEDKEEFDTSCISHMFISSPAGTNDSTSRMGAWYMLPSKSSGKVETLTSSDTVILYLHGNGCNRTMPHRIGLYRRFLSLGYYVLAVDYRGFGDSSPVELSETAVVADGRAALAWIANKLGDKVKVVVWGHSLGTGISTHMVAEFDLETGGNSSVCGLVLESPMNNILSEVQTYEASAAFVSKFCDLKKLVKDADVSFETDKWLPAVRCPVLILHAMDDAVIPYSLGRSLFSAATAAGKENINFVSYVSNLGYGHCGIYLDPGLAEEIKAFVSRLEGPEERASRLG